MDSFVLYFGGESISLTAARRGVNGTCVKVAHVEASYSGIVNGEFVDYSEIENIIPQLFASMPQTKFGFPKLYVGVPSCFCNVKVIANRKEFEKPQKFTKQDNGELIGIGRPVYYCIDGGNPIINAVGQIVQTHIEARISHFEIDKSFTDMINKFSLVNKIFNRVEFLPLVRSEANYLIPDFIRDKTCVLISNGMFSTSVSVVSGDEIVMLDTFFMGTAHVINDISVTLGVDFDKAREMFDGYQSGNMASAPIVKARIDDIAKRVKVILTSKDKMLLRRKIYLCGGYIDALPKIEEYFEKILGEHIQVLTCPFTERNEPDRVSRDAVITESILY